MTSECPTQPTDEPITSRTGGKFPAEIVNMRNETNSLKESVRLPLLLVFLILSGAVHAGGQEGFKSLFDGKTLEGWKVKIFQSFQIPIPVF